MGAPSAVDRFLYASETATIPACEAWADGATLDATVPNWRLHASGADAIRAEYARWFACPGRFEDVRRSPLARVAARRNGSGPCLSGGSLI